MTGGIGAYFLIGGAGAGATGITAGGITHTMNLAEIMFHAPKTPRAKSCNAFHVIHQFCDPPVQGVVIADGGGLAGLILP